jgi:hypothetical protein
LARIVPHGREKGRALGIGKHPISKAAKERRMTLAASAQWLAEEMGLA